MLKSGNNNVQKDIKQILKEFVKKSWKTKDFLTEDDLRCHLFCKLQSKLKEYPNASIHAEIRWYGDKTPKGRLPLKYRSDIVIIDRTDLRNNETPEFKLPSKGYRFNKYYCIIEVKLRRGNNKNNDNKYEKVIKEDIRKLQEIRRRTSENGNDKSYYVVIFDKKRKIKRLIEVHEMKIEHKIEDVWDE